MTRLTEICGICGGKGIVPHPKRRRQDGTIDMGDLQVSEMCGHCGGGGRVALDTTKIPEPEAIIDHSGE